MYWGVRGSVSVMSYSNEITWLRSLFQKHYSIHNLGLPYPASQREFGYGIEGKIDKRHVSVRDENEFNAFLRNTVPLYVSASVSEFMNPGIQPMEKKGLVGSDLIYEFDADDIDTSCKRVHDSWSCKSCGANGKGRVKKCTTCGKGTALDEWVCSECVSATKKQTFSLLSVLQNDFGFDEKSLFINFSGSKGYHVHVRSKNIFSLPKSARVELMDYLSMFEFDPALSGFSFDGKAYRCPKYARTSGHAKRLLDELLRLVESGTEDEWVIISGSSPRSIRSYLSDRVQWYKEIQSGYLPALPGKKTEAFWNNVLSHLVSVLRLPIDRQTSGDIYKLIRVPNTLHGSTGFRSDVISFSALSTYDPFVDAVAFSTLNERKLLVHHAPKLTIGGHTLEPVNEPTEMTLPCPLSVYLVGWGAATLR
ncbi:MAG: hypothetical protein FJY86_02985 [Candidatus Diapherotrites archaeon]|uniref:DNA primase small subunit PriS n=1 Tax=Candidatus Iainarchaeum sp. TaxID=3101447 RepID=A0A8T4C715_9ARCH|nr:hypothetical protein [Candidatus Diapherotrites archaeon]